MQRQEGVTSRQERHNREGHYHGAVCKGTVELTDAAAIIIQIYQNQAAGKKHRKEVTSGLVLTF